MQLLKELNFGVDSWKTVHDTYGAQSRFLWQGAREVLNLMLRWHLFASVLEFIWWFSFQHMCVLPPWPSFRHRRRWDTLNRCFAVIACLNSRLFSWRPGPFPGDSLEVFRWLGPFPGNSLEVFGRLSPFLGDSPEVRCDWQFVAYETRHWPGYQRRFKLGFPGLSQPSQSLYPIQCPWVFVMKETSRWLRPSRMELLISVWVGHLLSL